MIFETTVEKLISLVENADRVTARNASLPALNTILMIVSGNVLKLRATNLSLGIEFELGVKKEKDGVLALDGKTLYAFLSTLPKNEKIKLTQNESTLTLTTSRNTTTIKTHPYEDFPTLPSVSGTTIQIPQKEFIRGIKNTFFSAAVSDIKPEIASVYISAEKNTLYFVATDSFRLAEKKETIKKPVEFSPILIPYKNIIEIARILENTSDDINLIVGENQIVITAPGIYITSRLTSGSFPDYKQIIPKEFLTEAVVLKQDLLTTLKAANIFSDKFNQITFSLSPNKKKFECVSKNTDVGEYSGMIDATLSGDDVVIALNQRYLIECLSFIPQDSIAIGLNGGSKALVIRGVGDSSFTYLLMPMNR